MITFSRRFERWWCWRSLGGGVILAAVECHAILQTVSPEKSRVARNAVQSDQTEERNGGAASACSQTPEPSEGRRKQMQAVQILTAVPHLTVY